LDQNIYLGAHDVVAGLAGIRHRAELLLLHAQGHHVHTATAADGPALSLLDALVLGDLLLLEQLLLLLLLVVHPNAHKIYLKKRKKGKEV